MEIREEHVEEEENICIQQLKHYYKNTAQSIIADVIFSSFKLTQGSLFIWVGLDVQTTTGMTTQNIKYRNKEHKTLTPSTRTSLVAKFAKLLPSEVDGMRYFLLGQRDLLDELPADGDICRNFLPVGEVFLTSCFLMVIA